MSTVLELANQLSSELSQASFLPNVYSQSISFDEHGHKIASREFKGLLKHGEHIYYWDPKEQKTQTHPRCIFRYQNGWLHGAQEFYHQKTSIIATRIHFDNNKASGVQVFWDEQGTKVREVLWVNGEATSVTYFCPVTGAIIYTLKVHNKLNINIHLQHPTLLHKPHDFQSLSF